MGKTEKVNILSEKTISDLGGIIVCPETYIRLECLKLASNHADTQELILARAEKYLGWVINA